MQQFGVDCQGDEFPPAIVVSRMLLLRAVLFIVSRMRKLTFILQWQGRDSAANGQAWIRQVPGGQNAGAGNLFANICPDVPRSSAFNLHLLGVDDSGCRTTSHFQVTETTTWPAPVLEFSGNPGFAAGDSDGLQANPCWPATLVNDPGFALLLSDPYYIANPGILAQVQGLYPQPPPFQVTAGKVSQFQFVSNISG